MLHGQQPRTHSSYRRFIEHGVSAHYITCLSPQTFAFCRVLPMKNMSGQGVMSEGGKVDCFWFQYVHFFLLLPRCHHQMLNFLCPPEGLQKFSTASIDDLISGVQFANNYIQIINTDLDFCTAAQSFFRVRLHINITQNTFCFSTTLVHSFLVLLVEVLERNLKSAWRPMRLSSNCVDSQKLKT